METDQNRQRIPKIDGILLERRWEWVRPTPAVEEERRRQGRRASQAVLPLSQPSREQLHLERGPRVIARRTQTVCVETVRWAVAWVGEMFWVVVWRIGAGGGRMGAAI